MSASGVLGLIATLLSAPGCEPHLAANLVVEVPADIPPCLETVDGDLIIGTDAETLDFARLTDVTGKLDLTLSRRGRAVFPALERVHKGLEIELRGDVGLDLDRLEHVGGPVGLDLDPEQAYALLPGLRRLSGGLWLFGGGRLSRVLPALTRIGGTVFVQPSGPVTDALPALERIGGHLVLSNTGHVELAGLARLRRVDGGIYVFGGNGPALPALEAVGGALALRDTRAVSLDGLGREGVRVGALLLRDNPRLRTWPGHLRVDPDRVQIQGSPQLGGSPP